MDAPGSEAKSDYSFGQIAIQENICSFEQVKECLDIQSKLRSLGMQPKRLGEILIEKGYLNEAQAEQIILLQARNPARTPTPAQPQVQIPIPSPVAVAPRVAIPGYEMIAKIGQGAMGAVYKARQVSMDRLVAIKVLAPKYAQDRAFVERFLREARAVARLNHENIIAGIDFGESGGLHYFVMEFVNGITLAKILARDGRMEERRCLEIGLQIARALSHAHRNNIVHRDVKPENIMITPENVAKLCDLGLAKQTGGDAALTVDGMSVGTPNYISPEQARGNENIDIRSDIYSLGATFYHMITGTTPFSGPNPTVVMTKHVTDAVDPPKRRFPGISDGFNSLILKMMQKRREDRPQNPDVLMGEIEYLRRGSSVEAPLTLRPAAVRPPAEVVRKTEVHIAPVIRQRLRSSRSTFPVIPLLVFLGLLAAGVVFYSKFSGGLSWSPEDSSSGKRPAPSSRKNPGNSGNAAAKVAEEIAAFREIVNAKMLGSSDPDRITRPYLRIVKSIEEHGSRGEFVAQKAWEEELVAYVRKVNALINERVWGDIRKKAEEHYAAGRLSKAIEELQRLEEVYKWFRKDGMPERTEAGKAHEDLTAKISKEFNENYVTRKSEADQAFRDPRKRDEAYRILEFLAVDAGADRKAEIEAARREFFRVEIDELLGGGPQTAEYQRANARIRSLKGIHSGNGEALDALDQWSARLKEWEQKAVSGAAMQAAQACDEFFPKFEAAMKQRDLLGARRCLYSLCLARENAAIRPLVLTGSPDLALLQAYLDPARVARGDTRGVIAMAGKECWAATVSQTAKNLYLNLRELALLEELMEQALEGAKLASRDPGKFRTGYSEALKEASIVEPPARKPGEGYSLDITIKSSTGIAVRRTNLAPRVPPVLGEDDIVNLARRSCSPGPDYAAKAAADPLLAFKAFLLNYHAGRLPAAKSWADKLVTPEARLGFGRYADKFADAVSEDDEKKAKALYEEAYEFVRRREGANAEKRLHECLDKFSHTEYMKAKIPSTQKTRIETAENMLKSLGPGRK